MTEALFYVCLWFGLFQNVQCADHGIPAVKYAPVTQLAAMRYGNAYKTFSEGVKADIEANLVAVYHSAQRTIYVRDSVKDSNEHAINSVLVHELTHHFQWSRGEYQTARCANELEGAAYTAQNQYLTDHGFEPAMDEFSIRLYSMCGA